MVVTEADAKALVEEMQAVKKLLMLQLLAIGYVWTAPAWQGLF